MSHDVEIFYDSNDRTEMSFYYAFGENFECLGGGNGWFEKLWWETETEIIRGVIELSLEMHVSKLDSSIDIPSNAISFDPSTIPADAAGPVSSKSHKNLSQMVKISFAPN